MPADSSTPNGQTRREELLAVATKLFARAGITAPGWTTSPT